MGAAAMSHGFRRAGCPSSQGLLPRSPGRGLRLWMARPGRPCASGRHTRRPSGRGRLARAETAARGRWPRATASRRSARSRAVTSRPRRARSGRSCVGVACPGDGLPSSARASWLGRRRGSLVRATASRRGRLARVRGRGHESLVRSRAPVTACPLAPWPLVPGTLVRTRAAATGRSSEPRPPATARPAGACPPEPGLTPPPAPARGPARPGHGFSSQPAAGVAPSRRSPPQAPHPPSRPAAGAAPPRGGPPDLSGERVAPGGVGLNG